MFGTFELEQFEGLTKMPQGAASAWSAVENLVGVGYVPILYLGKQVAKGVDYLFIAEQTFMTHPPVRRVVSFVINEFQGQYELVEESMQVIAVG
ncbi:MAG: hypothetical protein IJP68_10010 [Selenomonadaceae bacterium]|nr:hypothetical protein [Selenomonadaceae bacterium]